MKQVMDAQGGFAKVKSFKDNVDVWDKNQFVKDQVAVQAAQQWYVNAVQHQGRRVPGRRADQDPGGPADRHGRRHRLRRRGRREEQVRSLLGRSTPRPRRPGPPPDRLMKTVEEKKSINTGLFTASPAADEAVRTQFVASGNADFDQVIGTFYEFCRAT